MSATPTRKRFPPLNASRKNSIWSSFTKASVCTSADPWTFISTLARSGNAPRPRASRPQNGVTIARCRRMRRITRPPPSRARLFAGSCVSARMRLPRTGRTPARPSRPPCPGVPPRRPLLLLMVKGAPGGVEFSTVSELCGRLQLAQSTVTELVQRAEEAGLVRKDPAKDDGRVGHLTLTPDGERKLAQVHNELRPEREALAHVLRQLQPESTADISP